MKTAQTQIEKRTEQAKSLKETVCQLLGWDEMKYAEYQYNAGLQYLQHYIPRDPEGIDQLASNRIFWNWWKNRWADRDQQYCNPGTAFLTPGTRLSMYHLVHNPEYLAKEIYPSGVVLSASYAVMINDVIKEEVI